jgi:hypothetical protein
METEKTVSIRAHTQQTAAQGGRLKPAAITARKTSSGTYFFSFSTSPGSA